MSIDFQKMHLLRKGKRIVRFSEDAKIMEFISFIRDQFVAVDLIRIGGDGDGGYLMPDDFDGVRHCFSPGVDTVATFEQHLYDHYGIQSFLADASVAAAPAGSAGFDFEQKFLGSQTVENFTTLGDWVARKDGVAGDNDMVLQMDIEGAEFEVLIETSTEVLNRFRMIVIEFHAMERLLNPDVLPFLQIVFNKLSQNFNIAHIHPNNCSRVTTYRGMTIPHVFEVTFIRKDRVDRLVNTDLVALPHAKDMPNNPEHDDFPMPDIWWKR